MDDAHHESYRTPTTSARWLPAVLAPLIVALILVGALGPASPDVDVAAALGTAVGWSAILIVTMLLVAILARYAGPKPAHTGREWRLAIGVVALFILLTSLAGRIPRMGVFGDLSANWQGKVIDLVWVSLLFALLWRWARADAGLRWRIRPGSGRPAVMTIAGVFALFVILGLIAAMTDAVDPDSIGLEQVLYDTTIPNLTEELIWRAAMLAVLDRAFGTPWTLAGARLGWGLVITSLVFGVGHMVLADPAGGFSLSIGGGIFATVMGVAMAWIWARTGSVWPAFLLHCAPEFGRDVGVLLGAL